MPWSFSRFPDVQPTDLARFLERLNAPADLFDRTQPVTVARAPGRLDLMGGIADYSGALVLQMPLAIAAYAALQKTAAPVIASRTASPAVS